MPWYCWALIGAVGVPLVSYVALRILVYLTLKNNDT